VVKEHMMDQTRSSKGEEEKRGERTVRGEPDGPRTREKEQRGGCGVDADAQAVGSRHFAVETTR